MRTATIIAEKLNGEFVLLFGPGTPIHEQDRAFRELRSIASHPEYASVRYQDSDSGARVHKFVTPDELKRREALRIASEQKANQSEAEQPQNPKSKNRMKKIVSAVALMLLAASSLSAASWNDAFGIAGGAYGSPGFSGAGQTYAVQGSVRSNTVYYVTSANGGGAPVYESITFKTDTLATTLDFWLPTNVLTIASNGSAGDTTIWLAASNTVGGDYTTLATNDLLIVQSGDVHQLAILSGNATSSQGVVTSNALKQTQIKIFGGLTNAPVAGGKVYKLARIQQWSPMAFAALTNQFAFQSTNAITPVGQFLPLAFSMYSDPIQFWGWAGYPSAVTMTFSNAGSIYVKGAYRRSW